jgi:hypothetical protein
VVYPTANTSYTVSGSNPGCAAIAKAISNVTVNALPVISVNSGTICEGGSFTMIPSGASTYTFSSGSAVVSPTTTSSYSVTGTSVHGCVSASPAVSTVTVYALPIISVNSGTICAGQSFTLIPSGASTYSFTCGSAIVNPPSTTCYSVTGTSVQGCVSASAAVCTVVVNALPTVVAGPDQTIYYGYGATQCATLTGNASGVAGPFAYSWSNGALTQSTSDCPTVTTVYDLTVTANGCSGTDQAIVNVIDVSCQKEKVMVCHNGHTICIASAAVPAHLAHGCNLGPCNVVVPQSYSTGPVSAERLAFSVYPNPNTGSFSVEMLDKTSNEEVKIEVRSSIGALIYSQTIAGDVLVKENIELGKDLPDGVYFVHLSKGAETQVTKLLLIK